MSEVKRFCVEHSDLAECFQGSSPEATDLVFYSEFDRVTAELDAGLAREAALAQNLKYAEEGYLSIAESADASAQTLHEVITRLRSERDAALLEVERLKNMDHRQILAESAAKYLLDRGAENFVGDVFTIEADDDQTKFEVLVTTQKVGAKSPGELCNELQQRLTAADERADVLEGFLKARESELEEFATEIRLAISDSQIRSAMTVIGRSRFLQLLQAYNSRIDAALKPAEGGGGDHVKHYECIGKGGDYTVVAIAQGAGTLKGFNHYVYKNADGVHFVRDPEDFLSRMQIKP